MTKAEIIIKDPNDNEYVVDGGASINNAWPVTHGDVITFDDVIGRFVDGFYDVTYNVWLAVANFVYVNDNVDVPGTILITSPGHNVRTGMKVTINGNRGTYDGDYDAVYVNANSFYVLADYVGDDSGIATPYHHNRYSPFVFANVEMAIDRMLAVFCNMDEGLQGDKYLEEIMLLKGLLMALRSAIMTTTRERINNIHGRITRILDYNRIELTYP